MRQVIQRKKSSKAVRGYRMSKSTGWVNTTAGQPVPTISRVKSSNFTVPVFTLNPLKRIIQANNSQKNTRSSKILSTIANKHLYQTMKVTINFWSEQEMNHKGKKKKKRQKGWPKNCKYLGKGSTVIQKHQPKNVSHHPNIQLPGLQNLSTTHSRAVMIIVN